MTTDYTRRAVWYNVALAGPLAAIFFTTSLIGFAALRTDGYTHGTKAVSELGAIGAPMALGFNVFGFLVPGIFILFFSLAILKIAPPKTSRAATALLALSGTSMMLAGIFPVDMNNTTSLISIAHALSAMTSGLFWAFSLGWFGSIFKNQLGLSLIGRLTPWFWLFLIANILWQVGWQTTGLFLPGWGQRIGFAGFFLWSSWVGLEIFLSRKLLS